MSRSRRHTRRQFLNDAVRLGTSLAALAALGPHNAQPALARSGSPERVQVLVADLSESTVADFARGQARGVAIVTTGGQVGLRATAGGTFTSGSLTLPFPATHVGLHWVIRSTAADAVAVEVRTSADGQTWSGWQLLTIEAVTDLAAGQEVFAALAGVPRAHFAQYRTTFQSGEPTTLASMTVTAINSVDGPREAVATAAVTSASFTTPDGKAFTVIPREGWGCDEGLRFRGRGELWPEMYVPAKKVVLHHTATANDYVDGAAEVRAIYTYHARTLRWGDIGYNSLIDKFGNIYEGRHGRGEDPATREVLSAAVVAGHVYGHNYGSTGVAAIGNFDQAQPTPAMTTAIDDVVTFECGRHFINPARSSDFLKSDGTWHTGLHNCSGHYESYNTACPGTVLKAYLDTLRANVATRLNWSTATMLSGPDQMTALTAPATLSFQWSSDVTSFCLEGWYKPADSENITYLTGYADAGYGDPLAKIQVWSNTNGALSGVFPNLAAGHYTMHVRAANGAYEANLTYLVKSATSTKPGRK